MTRTYPNPCLGAAESSFGSEQGVLEKRIPIGICFQTERSSGPKEPQPQRVSRATAFKTRVGIGSNLKRSARFVSLCFLICNILSSENVYSQINADIVSMDDALEEAVYLQEAKGDLDGAIVLFNRIVESDKAARPLAAEAQFRLAVCLLESGLENRAMKTLETLVDQFPDQTVWVEAALKRLPREFEPTIVPWKDGERLAFEVRNSNNNIVGVSTFVIRASDDGENATWNAFHSEVIDSVVFHAFVAFDQLSFKPTKGAMSHSILGKAKSEYRDQEIVASYEGHDGERSYSFEGKVLDNEQAIYFLRQLPIEVGFKTEFRVFVALSGVVATIGAEIKSVEKLDTIFGEIETYRVALNVMGSIQTYWISADALRRFVKMEISGMVAILSNSQLLDENGMAHFTNEELGYSIGYPGAWTFVERSNPGKGNLQRINFGWPQKQISCGLVVRSAKNTGENLATEVEKLAQESLEQNLRALHNCQLIEGTWQELMLGEVPARSFSAKHESRGGARKYYRGVAYDGERVFIFTGRSKPEDFDVFERECARIFKSIRMHL